MLFGVLLAVLAPATSARADEPTLTGFWESTETSLGGIGSALQFAADGRFEKLTVVQVDARYRLENDELVLTFGGESPHEAAAVVSQRLAIAFGPETMSVTSADGQQLDKKRIRVQAGEPSPLLGDWTYEMAGQGTCFERYRPDERMLFRLPLATQSGTYRIEKQRIRIAPSDGKTEKWRFARTGDTLLIGPKSRRVEYRRVEGGRWYRSP